MRGSAASPATHSIAPRVNADNLRINTFLAGARQPGNPDTWLDAVLLRFYRFGAHLGNRQRNGKLRAAFGAIARLHSAAMLENDLLYDGQPQAGAVGLGREKGAKHFLQRGRGNAWAAGDQPNLLRPILSGFFHAAQNDS